MSSPADGTELDGRVSTEKDLQNKYKPGAQRNELEQKFQGGFAEFVQGVRKCRPSDVLPVLIWFPSFLRSNPGRATLKDAVCGLTIAAIVLPQGMAYGMLAALPPVYGLYTAMLPCIGYAMCGTSMHLSIGPFALISMLSAEGVLAVVDNPETNPEAAVAAAGVLALLVGVILIAFGVLRLGFIATFLSDPVLSGYCTAVSIVIPTSQLKYAFQVKVKRGTFIKTVEGIVKELGKGSINWYSFGIFLASVGTIFTLQAINKSGKVAILKKFPLPAELIVVVLSTFVVFIFDFNKGPGVAILGPIPSGLPSIGFPKLADFDIGALISSAFMVALMTYITAMSVAKTFARKFHYEIDNNQELIALGVANVLGSISSCYPAAVSLSRTAVVGSSGASSPLHNVWTVLLLVVVLLFCGPLIETLPLAALAAIVVMAFKSLLQNGYGEMVSNWRISPIDFVMWSIAFWATLATNVTIGIALAVTSDVVFLFYKSTRPSHAVLGRLAGTERVYRNRKLFSEAEMIKGTMIFRFDAPLHFANREVFLTDLFRELRHHDAEMNGASEDTKDISFWHSIKDLGDAIVNGMVLQKQQLEEADGGTKVTSVIIDCSPMTHVDMSASRAVERLREELRARNTRLILAHVKYDCYKMLADMKLFEHYEKSEQFDVVCFRDLHDAVSYVEGRLLPEQETTSMQFGKKTRSKTQELYDAGVSTGFNNLHSELGHSDEVRSRKRSTCDVGVGDDGELLVHDGLDKACGQLEKKPSFAESGEGPEYSRI